MTSRGLDRRSFLLATAGAVLLGACGGSGGDGDDATADPVRDGAGIASGTALVPAFADGIRSPTSLATGSPQRAPFVLFDTGGPIVNDAPEGFDATLTDPAGSSTAVRLARHDRDIPTPYYPLLFAPTLAGEYALTVDVAGESQLLPLLVAEPAEVSTVQIGQAMRSAATPTLADTLGVDPVCTRFDPCPFHEVSLDQALTTGRPTVLLISTPGFCQTAVCGPVLELLIEAQGTNTAQVVHAEVYTDPTRIGEVNDLTSLLTPTMTTFGLDYEPQLVVADAAGIVTGRLDFTWDADEQAAALASAGL